MRRSAYNQYRAVKSLAIAARTNGTVNGTAVDRNQFRNGARSVSVIVFTGTMTDGSHAITLEESDDGSTGWTAVAASAREGSLPTLVAADDDVIYEFGFTGYKQFVRVVATTTGATTGGIFGAAVLLGNPRRVPIARS